jgi:dolichyl-phosphate-mannose-protein mannosyltransferase
MARDSIVITLAPARTSGDVCGNTLSLLSHLRKRDWQEPLILLSLLAFFLWVRFFTLEQIEIGGDAIQKWFFVRRWAYESPFDGTVWNHHLTRMGDNVPVFLIQKIFGTAPWVYYVGPTLAFVVAAFTVYVVGRRLSGRVTGVVAAVLTTTFSPMRRAASQMVPSAFSCMYVMLGAYFLVRYAQDESGSRRRWLVPCALSLFGAYLSHEPNVFFLPAFVLIIWLHGRNVRHVLLFLGILLGGFLLETALYASLTDYPSRLHITMRTHLGGSAGLRFDNAWGLLGRYRTADFGPAFRRHFYFWPFAAIGVAVLARQRLCRLFPLLPFSFLFLTTFLVRGIDPFRTLTSFQSRYLMVAVPSIVLTNVLFFGALAAFAWRWLGVGVERVERLRDLRERARHLFDRPAPSSPAAPADERPAARPRSLVGSILAVDLLWVVPLLLWFGKGYYPADPSAFLAKHPLVTWRATEAVITEAYRRNLPIIGPKKSVALAFYVYIDDATLLENGRLPKIGDKVGKYDKRRMFLSSDPARYERDARRKRSGKGGGKACVLELRRDSRFMPTPRQKSLPESCRAEGT